MPSNSLEQEAMDRVRRMYASFDNRGQRESSSHKPSREPKSESHKPATPEEKTADLQQDKTAPKNSVGMLDILMKDQDQSLILLLLVLLMKDGADMNLMLALIYILL